MVNVYRSVKDKVDYIPLGRHDKNDIKYIMMDDDPRICIYELKNDIYAITRPSVITEYGFQRYEPDNQELCVKKTY